MKRVALLIETSNVYGRGLLRGIRSWSRENDSWSFRLIEQGRGATTPSWLESWDGDGIIARIENPQIGSFLETLAIPVVDVSAALEKPSFPQVVTDSQEVVRLAVEHFESLGLRNFAYCGDDGFNWSRLRYRYLDETLTGRGFECLARNERISCPEAEIRRLGKWLLDLPKPVGVLACYDVRGNEVMEACRDVGLKVPEEVAVMGVHNDEILCELCDPPMSSIIPDKHKAGYEAAGILNRLMKSGKRSLNRISSVQVEPLGVAVRQSTNVIAVPDRKIARALTFIKDNACKGIGVSDVLRVEPMARTQLERKFRKLIGRSPREEIERVRMLRVQELLIHSSLPISSIADDAGFEYPEYLTVAFKRRFGMTPRAYRLERTR